MQRAVVFKNEALVYGWRTLEFDSNGLSESGDEARAIRPGSDYQSRQRNEKTNANWMAFATKIPCPSPLSISQDSSAVPTTIIGVPG